MALGARWYVKIEDSVEFREFPCDMLLLSSSNSNGKVTIMTANLDGESNLKTHSAPLLTRTYTQPDQLTNLKAQVICYSPDSKLDEFQGTLKVKKNDETIEFELSLQNVAFRGTKLEGTAFAQ